MKLMKKKYPAVLALIVSSLSVPAIAQDAKSSQGVKDARLESQILTTYQLSPYLRHDDITVTVEGDKATISGRVESDANKELATEIAQGVKGISKVDNTMITEDNYKKPARSTESSYAEIIDDASITAAVKSKLTWSRYVDGSTTKVATKKTAGVLGDDLALNAQQVSGVKPDRELPVVWAVFKGSARNKLILVPGALAIAAFEAWLDPQNFDDAGRQKRRLEELRAEIAASAT